MEHDPSRVYGENNTFRYVPVKGILVRTEGMADDDVAILLLGAKLCGVELHLSVEEGRPWIQKMNGYYASLAVETESELIDRLPEIAGGVQFLRAKGISNALFDAARVRELEVLDRPVLANGRLELLGFFRNRPSPRQCTVTAISFLRRTVSRELRLKNNTVRFRRSGGYFSGPGISAEYRLENEAGSPYSPPRLLTGF